MLELMAQALRLLPAGGAAPTAQLPPAVNRTFGEWLDVHWSELQTKGYGSRVAIPLTLRLDAIGMTVGDVIEHCRGTAKPGPTLLRKAGGGAIEESSLSARFAECIRAVLGDGAQHAD